MCLRRTGNVRFNRARPSLSSVLSRIVKYPKEEGSLPQLLPQNKTSSSGLDSCAIVIVVFSNAPILNIALARSALQLFKRQSNHFASSTSWRFAALSTWTQPYS